MTIDRRTHTRTREKTHFKTLSFKESLYRAHNLFSPLTSHVTSLFQHTRAHDPVNVWPGRLTRLGPLTALARRVWLTCGPSPTLASPSSTPASRGPWLRRDIHRQEKRRCFVDFYFLLFFFFEFVWIGFIGRSETGYPAGYSSTRKTHQGICSESSAPYDVPQFFLLFFFFVYEGKIARLASHRAYYCTNYCSIFGISSYLISPVGLTQLITNRIVSLLIEYNNMWFRFFSTFKLLY